MSRDNSTHPELPGFDYVSVLGSGGFSEVYLYRQKLPRRQVAVKVLRLEAEDTAIRREFVAEANAMARLSSHPSIATIFAADISPEGHPYLVMEYCPGGSLAASLKVTPISPDEVLKVGIRMASALESAHRAGIIHRDVKPSNILLNELKAPVLTDFGISIGGAVSDTTIMRDTSTLTTRSSGLSVPWAPPEAFLDDPPSDPRSDVYSLAATLFTLLEQRTPFELATGNNGAIALSRRIERGEITPPTAPDVPASLHDAIRDAMRPELDDRPSSALQFAERLQAVQRELSFAATPIEILGLADDPSPAAGGPPVGDTTVVRRPKRQEATVKRPAKRQESGTTDAEIDVDTRPRAPRAPGPGPVEPKPERRSRRPKRRTIVIAAAALVVIGTAVGIPVFSGTKVAPCPSAFADLVSRDNGGSDVRAIWWAYVPALLSGSPSVVCGVATDKTEIYILEDTLPAFSITKRLADAIDWTCTREATRYRCQQESSNAYLFIYDATSDEMRALIGHEQQTIYVEVFRPTRTY